MVYEYMKKKFKHKKVEDFTAELGESISFPIKVLPEYPKKIALVHADAVYYFYKLFDRIVVERTVTEDMQT